MGSQEVAVSTVIIQFPKQCSQPTELQQHLSYKARPPGCRWKTGWVWCPCWAANLPSSFQVPPQPLQEAAIFLLLLKDLFGCLLHPLPFPSVQTQGGLCLLCRPRELGSQSIAFPPTLLVYHCPPDSREYPFQALYKLVPIFKSQCLWRDRWRGVSGRACGSSTNSNMAPSVFLVRLPENKVLQGGVRETWYFISYRAPFGAAGLVLQYI